MSLLGMTRSTRDSGFSLLELMLVTGLIVAATVLLAPSFSNGMRSLEMQGAARDMVTRMRQARSEAVAKQKVFRIVFGETTPEETAGYALTDDYGQPIKSFDLPRGIRPEWEPRPAEETREVSFYPNGRSSGGVITLLGDRGRRLRIEVDPITGLARVVRPEGDEP